MIFPLSSHNPSTNLTAVRNRYLLGNNTNHNDFALLRVSALGPYLIPKAINWRHGDSFCLQPAQNLTSKTSRAAWITARIISIVYSSVDYKFIY
jgi:hypothetical protein